MQLRQHEAIQSKADQFRVDPRALKVEPGFNVRDLDAPAARPGLDELKADIRENGVQVPLEIRLNGEDLYITSGHRRHKVVMELISEGCEIETVPAIAEPKTISEPERVARLITLNAGEPLTPAEKAEVVRRLLNYGWERPKIATKFGVTPQTIANLEGYLGAPHEIQSAVRHGELSVTSAVSMVRAEGPEKATETLSRARQVAKSAGKSRITTKSIRAAAPPRPEPPRNGAKLDSAINLLFDLTTATIPAEALAAQYIARSAYDVQHVIEWLTVFEAELRRIEDRRSGISQLPEEEIADPVAAAAD